MDGTDPLRRPNGSVELAGRRALRATRLDEPAEAFSEPTPTEDQPTSTIDLPGDEGDQEQGWGTQPKPARLGGQTESASGVRPTLAEGDRIDPHAVVERGCPDSHEMPNATTHGTNMQTEFGSEVAQ